jgi:uncharacterized protein (TIGR02722 family)
LISFDRQVKSIRRRQGRAELVTNEFGSTDLQMIAEKMTGSLLETGIFQGRPTVTISTVKNKTSEYIDTTNVMNSIQTALVKSGKVRFTRSINEMQAGVDELQRQNQSGLYKQGKTTAKVGQMTAAKYSMEGELTSIVKQNSSTKDVFYKFTLKLFDVEGRHHRMAGRKRNPQDQQALTTWSHIMQLLTIRILPAIGATWPARGVCPGRAEDRRHRPGLFPDRGRIFRGGHRQVEQSNVHANKSTLTTDSQRAAAPMWPVPTATSTSASWVVHQRHQGRPAARHHFRLVQGKRVRRGNAQPTKAEQVLNQLQGGKMAKPVQQPEVNDIIARIKKGEFPGADYVLFGVLDQRGVPR